MRVFTERERVQFERKPDSLERLRGVAMSDARVSALLRDGNVLSDFGRGLRSLDARISDAKAAGAFTEIEFLAVSYDGEIFAVNTEGAAYARYAALVRTAEDAAPLLKAWQAAKRPAAPAGWQYLADSGMAECFAGADPATALYREEGEAALIASRDAHAGPADEWHAECALGDYCYAVSAGSRAAAVTLLNALAVELRAEAERDSGDFGRAAERVGFAEILGPSACR